MVDLEAKKLYKTHMLDCVLVVSSEFEYEFEKSNFDTKCKKSHDSLKRGISKWLRKQQGVGDVFDKSTGT